MRTQFIPFLLATTALSMAFAQGGDLRVTAKGKVVVDEYHSGPYNAGQVGDTVSVTFEIFLPGNPLIPGERTDYTLDNGTFQLDIAGAQLGSPTFPAYFEIAYHPQDPDWMRFSHGLTNGEFVAFELTRSTPMFLSADLSQHIGAYEVGHFGDLASMQITGSGGFLRMVLEEIAIGPEPSFEDFCDALPNSSGLACTLGGFWLPEVETGVHFEAEGGPPGEFGYVIGGDGLNLPGLMVGQGRLCLDLSPPHRIARFNANGPGWNSVGQFDALGIFQNQVGTSLTGPGFDLPASVPLPGAPAILAGTPWYFQVWYRDGIAGSNFSSGVQVTL